VAVSRLAILGTGLIGASIGLAAKRSGETRVAGFDPDPEMLATALERLSAHLGARRNHPLTKRRYYKRVDY